MAIHNPFEPGKLADLSDKINIVPNVWGVVNNLGLFNNEYKTQRTVLVPLENESVALIEDRNWNERHQANPNKTQQVLAFQVPHFPLDDMITPTDINGVMSWDSNFGESVQLAQVRAEKMARLRRSHALTLEYARVKMLMDGNVYAPNSTVAYNMYQEFTGTSTPKGMSIGLKSTGDNPLGQTQAIVNYIRQNSINGSVIANIVALCSPTFFADLTAHPYVYNEYNRFIQPGMEGTFELNLRNRLGQNVFTYGGITFIEYPAASDGTQWITDNYAIAFPMGTGHFRTMFAPAERFGDVNTVAKESYYFEFPSVKRDKIEIETETNFINVMTNPAANVKIQSVSN